MSLIKDIQAAAIAAVTTQVIPLVSTVTPDVPVALSPWEEFEFSVTASNIGIDAVDLTNVVYHLTVPSSPPIPQHVVAPYSSREIPIPKPFTSGPRCEE